MEKWREQAWIENWNKKEVRTYQRGRHLARWDHERDVDLCEERMKYYEFPERFEQGYRDEMARITKKGRKRKKMA